MCVLMEGNRQTLNAYPRVVAHGHSSKAASTLGFETFTTVHGVEGK
jgi:hypothetical protein